MSIVFYPFLGGRGVHVSVPYERMGAASALYAFVLENVWNKFGLNMLFRIPDI
jgi:hypothetical protein